MKLVEILKKANSAYFDEVLLNYFDKDTGELKPDGQGDGLAKFVVFEIAETYDEDASDEDQLNEATRVMESAIRDLHDVIRALT